MEIKKTIEKFHIQGYVRKMMYISEQLNKQEGRAIQFFYDYIKNKKTPPQQNMLLRALDGHPLTEKDEIQDVPFCTN